MKEECRRRIIAAMPVREKRNSAEEKERIDHRREQNQGTSESKIVMEEEIEGAVPRELVIERKERKDRLEGAVPSELVMERYLERKNVIWSKENKLDSNEKIGEKLEQPGNSLPPPSSQTTTPHPLQI